MASELYQNKSGGLVELTERKDGLVHFVRQGGGFPCHESAESFDARFTKVVEPLPYRKLRVSVDGFDPTFEAFSNGKLWNGWEMPCFTLEEGKKLYEVFDGPFYSSEIDAFILPPQDVGEEPTLTYAGTITVNGELLKVYPIGAGSWCWEEALPDAGGEVSLGAV